MKKCVLLTLALLSLSPLAQANLTLTAPPRETPEKGEAMYAPIARHLSKELGETVVYKHPGSWAKYSEDMRKDKYDIVFDGPHFAAWRMKHLGHKAAGKLPGNLVFVVITSTRETKVNKLRHLRRKKTCGLPSPNLGTVSFLSNFMTATVPPTVTEIKGGFKKVYNEFKAGKCDAAILRDTVYKKFSAAEKKAVKVVHTSPALSNQVFTVSKRVKDPAAVTRALTSAQGAAAAGKLLERFSKNAKKIQAATNKEYKGAEKYLEGVVWGW